MEHIYISITTKKNRTRATQNLLQTCSSNNIPATRQQTATTSNKVANILGNLTIFFKKEQKDTALGGVPSQLSPMCYQLG